MIDDGGLAFQKAELTLATSTATTTTNAVVLTIFTSAIPKSAVSIFTQPTFAKLRQFIDSFKTAGFAILSVKEEDTDYFFTLSDGSEIQVQSEDDPNDIVTKLSSIEADLQKEGTAGNVQYIDLRYNNKVYLKMK